MESQQQLDTEKAKALILKMLSSGIKKKQSQTNEDFLTELLDYHQPFIESIDGATIKIFDTTEFENHLDFKSKGFKNKWQSNENLGVIIRIPDESTNYQILNKVLLEVLEEQEAIKV